MANVKREHQATEFSYILICVCVACVCVFFDDWIKVFAIFVHNPVLSV